MAPKRKRAKSPTGARATRGSSRQRGLPPGGEEAIPEHEQDLEQERESSTQRLPQELWDRILSHLWSVPSPSAPTLTQYPAIWLSNFRFVNHEFHNAAKEAFLRRNIQHLHVPLDAPDVRGVSDILGLIAPKYPNPIESYVRTLTLVDHRKRRNDPQLTANEEAALRVELNALIVPMPNISEVSIWGVSTFPVALPSPDIGLRVALPLLYSHPAMRLTSIEFRGCDLHGPSLNHLMNLNASTLETIIFQTVFLHNGNWEPVLARWRDHCPNLSDLQIYRLVAASAPMNTMNQWRTNDYAHYSGPRPVRAFRKIGETDTKKQVETHHLNFSTTTMCKGRCAVRLGINAILLHKASALYDPQITVEGLRAQGLLK